MKYILPFVEKRGVNVISAIRWNMSLMMKKKTMLISFSVMLLFSLFNVVYSILRETNNGYSKTVDSFMGYLLFEGNPLLSVLYFLIPIIIILPYSTIGFTNSKSHVSSIQKIRFGIKKYYVSQYVTSFIGGFIVVFFPLLIGTIFNIIFLPSSKNVFNGNTFFVYLTQLSWKNYKSTNNPYSFFLPELFFDHPFLHILIFIFAFSVFSGLLSGLIYTFSFVIRKKAINAILLLEVLFFFSLLYKNKHNSLTTKNYNPIDYFTINSAPGKSLIIFLIFIFLIIILTVILLYKQIKRDQFED